MVLSRQGLVLLKRRYIFLFSDNTRKGSTIEKYLWVKFCSQLQMVVQGTTQLRFIFVEFRFDIEALWEIFCKIEIEILLEFQ